jgi:hypothetical protein
MELLLFPVNLGQNKLPAGRREYFDCPRRLKYATGLLKKGARSVPVVQISKIKSLVQEGLWRRSTDGRGGGNYQKVPEAHFEPSVRRYEIAIHNVSHQEGLSGHKYSKRFQQILRKLTKCFND